MSVHQPSPIRPTPAPHPFPLAPIGVSLSEWRGSRQTEELANGRPRGPEAGEPGATDMPLPVSFIALRPVPSYVRPSRRAEAMNTLLEKTETVVPTEHEVRQAAESSRILARTGSGDDLRVHLDDGQVLTLPRA